MMTQNNKSAEKQWRQNGRTGKTSESDRERQGQKHPRALRSRSVDRCGKLVLWLTCWMDRCGGLIDSWWMMIDDSSIHSWSASYRCDPVGILVDDGYSVLYLAFPIIGALLDLFTCEIIIRVWMIEGKQLKFLFLVACCLSNVSKCFAMIILFEIYAPIYAPFHLKITSRRRNSGLSKPGNRSLRQSTKVWPSLSRGHFRNQLLPKKTRGIYLLGTRAVARDQVPANTDTRISEAIGRQGNLAPDLLAKHWWVGIPGWNSDWQAGRMPRTFPNGFVHRLQRGCGCVIRQEHNRQRRENPKVRALWGKRETRHCLFWRRPAKALSQAPQAGHSQGGFVTSDGNVFAGCTRIDDP